MSKSVADLQQAIRIQSTDLQEELAALSKWEDEIIQRNKLSTFTRESTYTTVPIRGTEELLATTPSTPSVASPETFKEQGNDAFRRGDTEGAIKIYTKGIEAHPHGPTTHLIYGNRAMCYLKQKQWEKAEADAARCVDLNKSFTKGYFRRAIARKNLGKLRDARKDLETVLAFTPYDAETSAELKSVTLLISQEEKKAAVQTTKKKLVIQEVDDDEEENPQISTAIQPASAAPSSASATQQPQSQHKAFAEKSSMKSSTVPPVTTEKKTPTYIINSFVEELDDEEPVKASSHAPVVPARTKAPIIITNKTKSILDASSLKMPRNFSEFERLYTEIKCDQQLLDQYFALIAPVDMRVLFAMSLTSEIFSDLLSYATRASAATAYAVLQGICLVERLDEILMFLSDEETTTLKDAIHHAEAAGLSMESIRSTFGA